jgi:hypothetical protein
VLLFFSFTKLCLSRLDVGSFSHKRVAIYGAVLGGSASASGQAGMDYRIFSMHGVGVAGLMALQPDAVKAGIRHGV